MSAFVPDDKILLKLRRDAKIYMAQDRNALIYLVWDREDPGYIHIRTHSSDPLEWEVLKEWFYRRKLGLLHFSQWSRHDVCFRWSRYDANLVDDFVLLPLSSQWNEFP